MTEFLVGIGIPASVVATLKLATMGRLVLAAFLGGLVGLERELRGKPAGLRTVLLICVGATLLTELSFSIAAMGDAGGFRSDPARLAAQIIPGIGFIGAGAILHARGRVTGLTTAATLWVVTAIGIAVGSRAYVEAVGTTVLVLAALQLLAKLERVLNRRVTHRRYTVAVDDTAAFDRVREAARDAGLEARTEGMERSASDVELSFRVSGPREGHDRLVRYLVGDAGVRRFHRA